MQTERGLHLVSTNFSSAAPRSRGDSVHLRSRQAGDDLGAGARMGRMAAAAGTAPVLLKTRDLGCLICS